MKTNTFDLQQGISRPLTASSGSNSYVIIICCLLVVLAYILGYSAGSYHTDNSISQGGARHAAYGRFGHVAEPSVSGAVNSK